MMADELVRAAAGGDEDAFAQLVALHEKKVYNLALRMCGDPEDAWDAAQEAFLSAWRGLPSFRGEAGFSTWLYRLTSNAAIDLLRRTKRQRGEASLDDENLGIDAVDRTPSPQEQAEASERRGNGGAVPAHGQPPAGPGPPGGAGPELRGDRGGAGGGYGDGEVPDLPCQERPAKNFAGKREPIRLSAV